MHPLVHCMYEFHNFTIFGHLSSHDDDDHDDMIITLLLLAACDLAIDKTPSFSESLTVDEVRRRIKSRILFTIC